MRQERRLHVRLPIGLSKTALVVSAAAGFVGLSAAGLFLLSHVAPSAEMARDYEDCVEAISAGASTHDASPTASGAPRDSVMECNARFPGRRKPGGGYTYFDFMQDRNFDIAGPNPTAEEQGRIDREYVSFLDMQRREKISAALAKKQNEEIQMDLQKIHQPVGRPLILTPRNLKALRKRSPDRTLLPRCEGSSIACGWAKLSSAVSDSFASLARLKP